MAEATIGNMTLGELRQLILDLIEEQHSAHVFGTLEIDEAEIGADSAPDPRTIEEVLEAIERDRWTPPPGSPTPAQMIREDRDSR